MNVPGGTEDAAPPADPDRVLAEWRRIDEARQAGNVRVGVARREDVAGKTGIEIFRAMLAGELPAAPFASRFGIVLVSAEPGRVVFQGKPDFGYYNPLGTVHGGWAATLLDSALGCAVHTMLPAGRSYTTAELKVNYIRPITDRVPLVRAEGRVIHTGRRMATSDARLVGHDGKLYAHGSTTCFVFDVDDPA